MNAILCFLHHRIAFVMCSFLILRGGVVLAQIDDPSPPDDVVKLIFIHHSCGENWLDDWNGGLGIALRDNNYFVSDTYYGWGPDGIGDHTDIGQWWSWFLGPNSSAYLNALYTESDRMWDYYSRLAHDPGGENEIVMFKSCFPNSNLMGNPDDSRTTGGNLLRGQDCWSEHHTVANAKGIYNDLLTYFATRQDKLFIVVTAPPVQDGTWAHNARVFNTWLVEDWLLEYDDTYNNVAVFDFYNVLTSNGGSWYTNDLGWDTGNHHRYWNTCIEYITNQGSDTAAYPDGGGDDHPSQAGNQKATAEFVPLLNVFYHRWKSGNEDCSLRLATPNGGEIWCAGESQEITWSSESTSGSVTLEYSTDNGATWQPLLGDTPDDGTHAWTLPNTPSTNCLVMMCDVSDPACCDTSAGSFQICECGAIEIITEDLSEGMEGCPYGETVDAVGGCLPYLWSIESGQLPNGLELEDSSGTISGLPNEIGTFPFTLRVSDVLGDSDLKQFSIQVNEYALRKGDANCDGPIDILDAIFIVNVILDIVNPTGDQQWCADCNGPAGDCSGDGEVNILDAVKIVGLILNTDECP